MRYLAVLLSLLMPCLAFAADQVLEISVTPTVSSGVAYTAGDVVGSLMTIPLGSRALIQDVVVSDQDVQSGNYDIIFFSSNPSASTFTDNGALTINDADVAKAACPRGVTTQFAGTGSGLTAAAFVSCGIVSGANDSKVYAVLRTNSAVTFTSTTAITVKVTVLSAS